MFEYRACHFFIKPFNERCINRFFDSMISHPKIPPYAWVPFGHGAHLCLGMKFATLEIKAFIYQILLHYEIALTANYAFSISGLPVAKPTDDVPLVFCERKS
ncbi:cytochrome P450 [Agaribacter flavus]|uniref:Cytochrome P450 n=1 Tax=Agaribacter flavus TaxID=1902781 RepID=A0ABV7FR91_9ALTE